MNKRYNEKVKYIGLIIIVIGILYYGYHQTRNLILGSVIEIISPTNGQSVEDKFVDIEGNIKNASYIYLNGKQIFTDEENNIKENVLLFEGQNFFQIKTVDKFDKEKTKNIEVIYQPKSKSLETEVQNDIIISN